MENWEEVFKIIYDCAINNRLINNQEIEKIIMLLVHEKKLNDYVENIEFKNSIFNNLASFSKNKKLISIYGNVINIMINNIDKNLNFYSDLSKVFYHNLAILQVILHELEHANQEKIMLNDNNLEAYILKISSVLSPLDYEISPGERLAEIKSFTELQKLRNFFKRNNSAMNILSCELLKRKLNGYSFNYGKVESPFVKYAQGYRSRLFENYSWYSEDKDIFLDNVSRIYNLEERLFYGFPISNDEFIFQMCDLILGMKDYYNGKIKVLK